MPVIADLQLTITPATGLYSTTVPDGVIVASENTDQGRNQIVLDFNGGDGLYARDLGTIFQWPMLAGTVLRRWQPSILPMPETIFSRATDWDDGGFPGAKFFQGYMVTADSYNLPKTFQIVSQDDQTIHTVFETPATFSNRQSEIAFSCDPFIAHAARLASTDGVRWRVWKSRPIFQPYPELGTVWKTEMVNFGMGWQHVRLLNIPYIAANPVTMTLIFDQQANMVISGQMPATASLLYPTKQKVIPSANKSKLIGFQATSSSPFRIFQEMLEVWVGPWGRTDSYTVVRPFGGKAATGAEV